MPITTIRQATPFVAGALTSPPEYLVIHGSRSNKPARTTQQEFDATRTWCLTNDGGLGWNATVGDDMIAIHMPADRWGWHARESSPVSLGIELAQPTVAHAISDAQVRALAHLIVHYVQARWPGFDPAAPGRLRMHSELPAGKRDGKTDVFPVGDGRWPELVRRLLAQLGAPLSINDLFDRYLAQHPEVGRALYRADVSGRGHWGDETNGLLPLVRTSGGALLTISGGVVTPVTAFALDDWETAFKQQINRYG